MEFTCKSKDLNEAINNVIRAVPQKSPMPALECIKLFIDGSKLSLTGYDLELAIVTHIDAQSMDHGEILVNAKIFSDIIRKLPYENVTIKVDENLKMTITSGSAIFNIPSISADDYPKVLEIDRSDFFKFSQPVLKNMIEQTIFAVAVSDSKPILKGELFDIENGEFNLVAIDGFRLAVRKEKIDTDDRFYFVVKSKALSELQRILSNDPDDEITVYVTKKHAAFEMGSYTLITRLLEGEFHKYKGSIPTKFNTEAEVETRAINDVLDRCMVMIVEHTKAAVRCNFNNGSVYVTVSTSLGNYSDECSVNMTGDPVEIGFNCRYFLDALKASQSDKIRIKLGGSLSPITILPYDGDDFIFLVLPVRLKN